MQFLLTTIILSATIILNLALLAFVFYSSQGEHKLKRLFALHVGSIIGWAVFILIIIWLPRLLNENIFLVGSIGFWTEQLIFFFGALMVSTNFWFAYYVTHRKIRTTVLTVIFSLLQFGAILGSLIPGFFFTSVTIEPTGYALLEITAANIIYSLFLLTHLFAPPAILFFGRKHAVSQQHYQQLFLLSLVYLLFLFVSMTLNWVLPVYFGIFVFNALGPTTSLIVVIGISYAIVRYQFLDIRVIIQRGFIYTVLFVFISLTYLSLLSITNLLFDKQGMVDDFFSGLVATIIGVFTVPRLDRWLRKVTDRFFFKDRYDYSTAIQDLSAALQSSLNMDTLLNTCEEELAKILRAEYVRIKQKRYSPQDNDVTVPIKLNDKLSGVMVVGPKRSGELYNEKDMSLLQTFATQTATAISRVLLYQEVKRRAEELEEKVVERTHELQSAQENQRSMMLHISHNLQTPLAILQTKIEGLKNNDEAAEAVQNLESSIQQTSRSIHDMLRFARLEGGHEELDLEKCSVSELLVEIAEEVRTIAEISDITVSIEHNEPTELKTDCHKLREIIMNLASNAIKYMGKSTTRQVSFSLTHENDMVKIAVRDTGVGISADEVSQIFKDFYRSNNTITDKGTGLGLAITQRLTRQLGGTITLESEPKVGSTFVVLLPKAS